MGVMARLLPRSGSGRAALVLIVVAWLIGGIAVGRIHAWNQSVGGMTAAFGGIIFAVAALALLVFGIAAVIGERALRAPRGSAGRATKVGLAALIVGGLLGYATAAATGGTYREPVIRESTGTANAVITSPDTTFIPTADGPATCRSVSDEDTLGEVTALDLGELGDGTLRAFAWVESETGVRLELFIDGADVADGLAPSWAGLASVRSRSVDGMSATIAFDGLSIVTDPKLPTPAAAWPKALSGSLGWTCEPFE